MTSSFRKLKVGRLAAGAAAMGVAVSLGFVAPANAEEWEEIDRSTANCSSAGSWNGWQAECDIQVTERRTIDFCSSPDLGMTLSSWTGMMDWYSICYKTYTVQ